MKPPAPTRFLLAAMVAALASCGHTPDAPDEFADVAPKSSAPRVWSVSGMTVPGVGTSQGILPIGEHPMGPDASLAGSGQLEQAVAAVPGEPLPDGGSINLDSPIMPDGSPAAAETQAQSPYDPALLNPPATVSPTPGAETPAPAPGATPSTPAPGSTAPAESPAPAETPAPAAGQ